MANERNKRGGTRSDTGANVLRILTKGPTSSADIARQLGISVSMVSASLSRLADRDLVVRIAGTHSPMLWTAIARNDGRALERAWRGVSDDRAIR